MDLYENAGELTRNCIDLTILSRKKSISVRCHTTAKYSRWSLQPVGVQANDFTNVSIVSESKSSCLYWRMLRRWQSRFIIVCAVGNGPTGAACSAVTSWHSTAPTGHTAKQCWQFKQNRSSSGRTCGKPFSPMVRILTMQSFTHALHFKHFDSSIRIILVFLQFRRQLHVANILIKKHFNPS